MHEIIIKSKAIYIGILLSIISVFSSHAQKEVFTELKGPYLGQKPPGMTPELFAPVIFKRIAGNSVHSSPSFSSDGKEMYYTVMPTEGPFVIKHMKMIGETWTKPVTVSFTKNTGGHNSLFANNDDIIIFKSEAPRHDQYNVSTLFQVKRENGIWGNPNVLDTLFDGLSLGVSVTHSGTIYFTLAKKGHGSYDIYKSKLIEGKYTIPEKLGPEINCNLADWQPFIAPDESYLIFSRYKGKPKQGIINLYISFKKPDGNWTEALNMGESINEKDAAWPYVSPDGKYLFFVSSKDNDSWFYKVYWVDAEIIEKLIQEKFKERRMP